METLKEIHDDWLKKDVKTLQCSDSIENKLRKSMIEDIRELRSGKLINLGKDEEDGTLINVIARDMPQGKIETFHIEAYIKHKFNIIEQDLKGK